MTQFKLFLAAAITTLFLVGCSVTPTPPSPPPPAPTATPTPDPGKHRVKTFCPQLSCNGSGCTCVGSTEICVDSVCNTTQCECDVIR